jgi:hypothetical protein
MPNDHLTSRPLLILDLDETLIRGTETCLHRDADLQVEPFLIYKRLHLDAFLRALAGEFALVLWSSGSADYVGEDELLRVAAGKPLAIVIVAHLVPGNW